MNTSRNTYFNFKHQPNEHKECQRTSSRIQVCERQEALQLTFWDFLSTRKIVEFIIIVTVLCPIITASESFRYYELFAKYIKAC